MLILLFGLITGLSLGLTGAGGSILAVPLLVFGLGLAPHEAVRVSLLVVALTALLGAVTAWRQQVVSLKAGLVFAATGMLFAPLGVMVGKHIDGQALLLAFAVLTVFVSVSMWHRASHSPEETRVVRSNLGAGLASDPVCRLSESGRLRLNAPCAGMLALCGVLVGVLSGLFGVGGGFLIVPILMFVTQMKVHGAVGTSLLVIALVGGAGALMGVSQGGLNWQLVGLFLAGGAVGMLLGRFGAGRLAGPQLQKVFAAAVFLIGVSMLMQQVAGIES